MTWVTVSLAAMTMVGMAALMSFILGWASKAFHVELDPRVEAVIDALPGTNCGGCGNAGCSDYAEAVVAGKAAVNGCNVGGASCATALAEVMGVEAEEVVPRRPVVHCGARYDDRLGRHEYRGEKRCVTANLVADIQGCTYGCVGLGDCVEVCEYDAIDVVEGLAIVDYEKCIGDGACAKICPRKIITMEPFRSERMLSVACSNRDSGRDVKAVCKAGCIACKMCARSCSLFKMDENLAVLDYEHYTTDTLECRKQAQEKCPTNIIISVGT